MKTLQEFDMPFCQSMQNLEIALKKSYNDIDKDYTFDLSKTDLTMACINRLQSYYSTHDKIKAFLNKRYAAAGADFFVESILFFLNLYLKKLNKNFEVHSERQIKRRRGAIRPDISLWNGEEVVGIIECKTQLGYDRKNWESKFLLREETLKRDFPNAKAYLLVMTEDNWGGFGQDSNVGKKYFSIFIDKVRPRNFANQNQIRTPLEDLFKEIGNLISS